MARHTPPRALTQGKWLFEIEIEIEIENERENTIVLRQTMGNLRGPRCC